MILTVRDARFLFGLHQLLKLLERHSELPQNLEKQWRADFAATVERNCDGPSVRMIPALVAPGLSRLGKTQSSRRVLKLAGGGARHEGIQWCRRATKCLFLSTLRQSCERRWRVRPAPVRAWASARSSLE